MKKRYYIAAMFAFGLVAQPAILRANAADEANSIEAVQQHKQRISGLLTDSNGDPIIGATMVPSDFVTLYAEVQELSRNITARNTPGINFKVILFILFGFLNCYKYNE